MAIDSLKITQDNKIGNCDLLSIHNPLVFIVEVEYSLSKPEQLNVEVLDAAGVLLGLFRAIEYYIDSDSDKITYLFKSNDVLDAYMGDIEDFETAEGLLEYVEGITKMFTLRFYIDAFEESTTFVAFHSARQFGQTPAAENIYYNEGLCFYGAIGEPVYVYFYNANEGSDLNVGGPSGADDYYLEYDDTPFQEYNDNLFRGN